MKRASAPRADRRAFERHRHRVPCTLQVDGTCHRVMVLDLSPRGLFLQTRVPVAQGATVRVFLVPAGEPAVEIEAKVVRCRGSHPTLAPVHVGGIGLEIVGASERYYQLVLDWTRPSA